MLALINLVCSSIFFFTNKPIIMNIPSVAIFSISSLIILVTLILYTKNAEQF